MEIDKAKEIVTQLANGIDPVTGEIFPDNSPYNNQLIIRALFTILSGVHIEKKQKKLTTEEKQALNLSNSRPRNAGLPWTEDQRQEVAMQFKQGKSTYDLAHHFERTEGAIISELEHQGIVVKER